MINSEFYDNRKGRNAQYNTNPYMTWFKRVFLRCVYPLVGFLALLWFLIRVTPKPSRAAYPCQRAAFPIAGGFVIWLAGFTGSLLAMRKARFVYQKSSYLTAALCVIAAVGCLFWSMSMTHSPLATADTPIGPANEPIGTGLGIHPGRVVWIHNAQATSWDGISGHWWDDASTDQAVVDNMMSQTIRYLCSSANDAAGWQTLFRNFNYTHNKGDIGYQPGEKIVVKINLNNNRYSYDDYLANKIDTSPQVILALLRQLVYQAGIPAGDITVYDSVRYVGDNIWDRCHGEFPDVRFVDCGGINGRILATPTATPLLHLSNRSFSSVLPTCVAEADYLINLACLKSHEQGGITLCGKNHYGSLYNNPSTALHSNLPDVFPGMGHYRTLVDLMGHHDLGGKTLLYLVDGLYGGNGYSAKPTRWSMPPFNVDWPSSLLASQDPVAIDSVGFDFLYAEWQINPHMSGAEDYLHEAAQADNPPSGTFYDPEDDGVGLSSLGVHEHWNNSIDKQYTRNLETGGGIELVSEPPESVLGDFNGDGLVDQSDLSILTTAWLSSSGSPNWNPICDIAPPGGDGQINFEDFGVVSQEW